MVPKATVIYLYSKEANNEAKMKRASACVKPRTGCTIV